MIAKEGLCTGNIHATGMVYDGFGLMIRGKSGAGKSLLALHLLEYAPLAGKRAILVGDDRIELDFRDTNLWMHGVENLAGRIEMYGRGIVKRPFVKSAQVHLVVDLMERQERMPEQSAFVIGLGKIQIARCPVPEISLSGLDHMRILVLEALGELGAAPAPA